MSYCALSRDMGKISGHLKKRKDGMKEILKRISI